MQSVNDKLDLLAKLTSTELLQEEKYWLDKTAGVADKTQLHFESLHSANDAGNHRQEFAIPKACSLKIQALTDGNALSTFVVLEAVLRMQLHLYLDQAQISTIAPILAESATEDRINDSVYLLSELDGDRSFQSIVVEMGEVVQEAYENHQFPRELILEKYNKGKKGGDLSNVFISYEGLHQPLSTIPSDSFSFSFRKESGAIAFSLEAGPGVPPIFVAQLGNHYVNLLAQAFEQPKEPLKNLVYMTAEEIEYLTQGLNQVQAFEGELAGHSLNSLFEAQVERHPENLCTKDDFVSLTYREVNAAANQMAHMLLEKGVEKGEIVGIYFERSTDLLVSILGVLKAGATFFMIDPALPPERIDQMLADLPLRLVLSKIPYTFTLSDPRIEVIDIEDAGLQGQATDNPTSLSSPEDNAYLMFTSGSTGTPKGVLVRHGAFVQRIAWMTERFDWQAGDLTMQKTPLSFDPSICEMFRGMLAGSGVYFLAFDQEKNPQAIAEAVQKHGVTSVDFVPSALSVFLDYVNSIEGELEKLATLKWIITGAERLSAKVVDKFNAALHAPYGARLINTWGATEVTVDVTHYDCSTHDSALTTVPVGKPMTNVELYLLNSHQQFAPFGTSGELYVSGDFLATGYLNAEELNSEKFITLPAFGDKRFYRTGDFARWSLNGQLEFIGRKDEQFKIKGVRVERGDVESQILKEPHVSQVLVEALQDEDNGNYNLVCYMILDGKAGPEVNENTIKESIKKRLPAYMVPDFFFILDAFPLTQNEKVDKVKLPQPSDQKQGGGQAYVAPSTDLETRLVLIWQELLNKDQIGVNDVFFDIGGHSLNATSLVTNIYKRLNIKLELRDIFNNFTVKKLAEYITSNDLETTYDEIPNVEEKLYYKTSYAQKRLWTLSNFEEASVAYNVPVICKIKGQLDFDCATKAYGDVIERHESLRTIFAIVEGEIVQQILPYDDAFAHITFRDFRGMEDQEAQADAFVTEFIAQKFDLATGPLVNTEIIQLSDDEYLLGMCMHHIISDTWSLKILVRDWLAFYGKHAHGTAVQIAPLKIQNKDYAEWENESFDEKNKNYWLEKLSGELPKIDLPAFKERPRRQTFNGTHFIRMVPPSTVRTLGKIGNEYNSTLFMSVVSIFSYIFHKYTQHKKIVMGTVMANRDRVALQDQVGFYINTLVVCNELEPTDLFSELFKNTKQSILEAFEHKDYPYDQLVNDLKVERDLGRSAIFDVLIETQNFSNMVQAEPEGGDDLEISLLRSNNDTAIFDLNIMMAEDAKGGIIFNARYNTDVYDEAQIERLFAHFNHIAAQLAKSVEKPLHEYNLLLEEDRQMIELFNQTDRAFSRQTLVEYIAETARTDGERRAVRFNGQDLSYQDIQSESNRIAHFMNDRFERGNYVGVLMDRSPDLLNTILGLWKSGHIYVPIDPTFPFDRIKNLIDNSGIDTLVFGKAYVKETLQLQWQCPQLNHTLCIDSLNVEREEESANSTMQRELWEYVGERADDDITGGGWLSSYTGEPLSRAEMDEYRENVLNKVKEVVDSNSKVLEIGCASGITMFAIAPLVQSYHGVDLSYTILKKNEVRIQEEGHANISQSCLFAHEIDQLEAGDFDLIIINSVIQNFHGYNYLTDVLAKCITKLGAKGRIFVGDVMDVAQKDDLIQSIRDYQNENPDAKAKLDWHEEFFAGKSYFDHLPHRFESVVAVEHSDKQGSLKNELSEFRYDTFITVDKTADGIDKGVQQKFQYDLSDVRAASDADLNLCEILDSSYVIHTSGSTGKPKGAIVHHLGMMNHIFSKVHEMDVTSSSIIAQNASQGFDISIWQLFTALVQGGTTVIYDNETVLHPERFLQTVHDDEVTILEVVPSYLSLLIDTVEVTGDLSVFEHLDYLMVTGETVHVELVARWFEKCPNIPVINAYGPTEASDDITHYKMTETPTASSVFIGKTVQNFNIYIIDEHFQQVPVGVKGEIVVAGVGVGNGYLNEPEKTAAVFMTDPFQEGDVPLYKTGDIGRYRPDGNVEFFGRKDAQVKVNGHRIELGEIESQLLKHDAVKQAAVIVKSAGSAKSLVAFVVGKDKSEDPERADQIRHFLLSQLPEYMVPSQIVLLESLPLNPNGKIDRKVLGKMRLDDQQLSAKTTVAPKTKYEAKLLDIWKNILGIDTLGVRDSFFENGGNSISAIQVITKVKKTFQVDIPLKDLFEYPFVDEFAMKVEAYKAEKAMEALPEPSPKGIKAKYKISPVQYAEWYLQKFNPHSTFYNIGFIVELDGPLQVKALHETVAYIFNRHDAFRTALIEEDGIPYQVLQESIDFPLSDFHIDIRDHAEKDAELQRLVDTHCNNVFDFTKPPICSIKLVQVEDEKFVLAFETHHIVWDQMSTFNFYREITEGYNQMVATGSISLPEIAINYVDYTEWLNGLIDSGRLEKQKQYWLDRYQEIPEPLELPTDFKRPAVHTFNGAAVFRNVGLDFKQEITDFCNENGITYQIFLISVLNLLLHRLSNQDDFVVGTPIWNRDQEHLDKIIGLFASAIPIRCTLEEGWTFHDLLMHTKKSSLEAYENHLYPFNKVIEELNPTTDFSRQKVISVFFGVQNDDTELSEREFEAVEVRDISGEHALKINDTSVFDFTMQVDHSKHHMWISLRYNTDLFLPSTAETFMQRYENLVRETLSNPNLPVQDFELLTGAEQELLGEFVENKDIFEVEEKGIHQVIERKANEIPNATAIIEGERKVTYGEMERRANIIANHLLAQGVFKQERVGVLLPKSADFVCTVLGILKAGAIYVPLSKEYPVKRIEDIVGQGEIKRIVSIGDWITTAHAEASFGQSFIDLDLIDASALSDAAPDVKVSPEDLIYTVFTSGSTGTPKGIDIKHLGVVNIVESIADQFELTADETILFHTAVVFDASIMDFFLPLAKGAKIVVMDEADESDIHTYERYVTDYGITHMQMVPLVLESIVDGVERKKIGNLPGLKRIAVGGAILYAQLKQRFFEVMDCGLFNCYGPTETTVDATVFSCSAEDISKHDIIPVGRPVFNTKVYILDANMKPSPIGVPGEMYISSIGAAQGYLNDPEKTAGAFLENPFDDGISSILYKTGDKAEYLADGNLIVYGRLDNQVKVNGNRVEIEEIESVMAMHPQVFNAAVLLEKKGTYDQLIGFVELQDTANVLSISENGSTTWLSASQNAQVGQDILSALQANDVQEELAPKFEELLFDWADFQIGTYVDGRFAAGIVALPASSSAFDGLADLDYAALLAAQAKGGSPNALVLVAVAAADKMEGEVLGQLLQVIGAQHGLSELLVFDAENGSLKPQAFDQRPSNNVYVDKESIKAHLANHLPPYMIPGQFIFLNKIPVNTSGKNDKNKLKAMETVVVKASAPKSLNETQKQVKAFFEEILDRPNMDVHASFFESGGHSINMIQLISRIEKAFGIKMPIVEVFNHNSIFGISKFIDKVKETGKEREYLHQLTSGGTKDIVCIPSISTSVADFFEVAKHLDGYNVYAFDLAFFDDHSDIFQSREEILDACLNMIFKSGIQGEFDLLGYSAGGILAYELLKKMKDYHQAKRLVLLDITPPARKFQKVEKAVQYHDADIAPFLAMRNLEDLEEEKRKVYEQRVWKYSELIHYARSNKVLDLPFFIFSCETSNVERQGLWAELTNGPVETILLEGDHNYILQKEHVAENAEIILNALAQ